MTRLGLCRGRKRLVAFVNLPIDLAALVFSGDIVSQCPVCLGVSYLPSTHHATSGEHCIVHRICLDVAAPTDELNLDHNKVVDVLKIVPYTLPGMC